MGGHRVCGREQAAPRRAYSMFGTQGHSHGGGRLEIRGDVGKCSVHDSSIVASTSRSKTVSFLARGLRTRPEGDLPLGLDVSGLNSEPLYSSVVQRFMHVSVHSSI